jgi:TonB family protein
MEDPPVFFMGNDSISTWVESQIHYPPEAKDNGIEGYVVISFIIDQTGKVGNVRITRPANNLLNQEAIRVIRSMPDWQPGRQHGKPVSVEFTLPVRFRL